MRKIYLSGNMSPDPQYYQDWTSQMADDLEGHYICSISKFKAAAESKYIVHHDLARLKVCDILVVNLGITEQHHHLTGAVVEVYEAFKQNKPVYAFWDDSSDIVRSQQASSPWIQEFVTNEFYDYEDLIDHLKFEENL